MGDSRDEHAGALNILAIDRPTYSGDEQSVGLAGVEAATLFSKARILRGN